MNIIETKISDIIPYHNNAKKHDQKQINNVAESIKQYGFVQPIVVDSNNIIVIGHCRYEAAKKLKMQTVPCVCVDDLTEEQVKALRIVDNKSNESDWDMDLLSDELVEIDLSGFDFDFGLDNDDKEIDLVQHDKLSDLFLFPPFSVLDGRTGEWANRKKQWLSIGIKSELGRKENLINATKTPDYLNNGIKTIAQNTSIFDPCLCELLYKWFCPNNGKILDPFAGGSVRGVVATYLGYEYYGNDLRAEQIEANRKNAEEIGVNIPHWTCGDSKNIQDLILMRNFDMIFSCPPYFDLEVYSDDPADISNMNYTDFLGSYREIIKKSCEMLANDRFAVFVVGDIRDKKGFYRDFISDTKKAFIDAGCFLYNEIIKIDPIGTAASLAKSYFKNRKTVKIHQNVLVFYKGNPANIKNNFGEIQFAEFDENIDIDD